MAFPHLWSLTLLSLKGLGSLLKFLDLTTWCQIDSPVHDTVVGFDSPLHYAAVGFDSKLHHAAERYYRKCFVSLPASFAAVRSDFPLHDAVGNLISSLQKSSRKIGLPAAWSNSKISAKTIDLTPRSIRQRRDLTFCCQMQQQDLTAHCIMQWRELGSQASIKITPRFENKFEKN